MNYRPKYSPRWQPKVEYVNDPKHIDTIDTLSVAMVANNIGHAKDSNRSGKFHGSFTQSSTEPQIQPNLFERMNNCNELSPQIFTAQNKFSLEILSRINSIKEYVAESSSRSKQYMPQKFAEMSSKFRYGQEFIEKLGILSNFVDRCLHSFAQYCISTFLN